MMDARQVPQGYILPLCWLCWLSSPGRIAPHRSHRSCGGSPCTDPEHRCKSHCYTCTATMNFSRRYPTEMHIRTQMLDMKWSLTSQVASLCDILSTSVGVLLWRACSSCMVLGMDTGGQVSAMYLLFASSRSLSSSSSIPLAMDSIKLFKKNNVHVTLSVHADSK